MMQPEIHKLTSLGIDINTFKTYQVLCLPENLLSAENAEELYDADDTANLSKQLKAAGIKCANSFDLGITKASVLERRGGDLWLGLVWIIGNIAIPLVVGIIASLIAANVHDRSKSKRQVHISLFLESEKGLTKLKYDGDTETLIRLLNAINQDKSAQNDKDAK